MRTRGWVAIGVGSIVAVAAALGYWHATGGFDRSRTRPMWLTERPIAHRGLHTGDSRVPENSLAAFDAAANADYAIELDVQRTSDGQLVVLHDANLERMTGVACDVSDLPAAEVTRLRLLESTQTVPTLAQVLGTVGGRVPVLVEVKNVGAAGALENDVAKELSSANTRVAVISFNPFSLARIASLAPAIPRGQVSSTFSGEKVAWWKKLLLRHLLLNWKSRPDFVVYQLEGLPYWGTSLQKLRGRPLIVWTAVTQGDYRRAQALGDAVEFELGGTPPAQ
jgi:glycerophosphoryl diester phosphodiesterase